MATNIAEQLVRGSRKIDQMRIDFADVITLLFGYLGANLIDPLEKDIFSTDHELIFDKGAEHWKVGRRGVKAGLLYFEFYVSPWDGYRTVYHSDNLQNPAAKDVQGLWDSLPILIDGLVEKCPELKIKWAPLLKAAE